MRTARKNRALVVQKQKELEALNPESIPKKETIRSIIEKIDKDLDQQEKNKVI